MSKKDKSRKKFEVRLVRVEGSKPKPEGWTREAEERAEAEAWAKELGLPSPDEQERRARDWGCPSSVDS